MNRAVFMRMIRVVWSMLAVVAVSNCFLAGPAVAEESPERVRKPAFAGMFYPDDPKELKSEVAKWLSAATADKHSQPIKAILAPHAGYVFCGSTIAAAYKQIEGPRFTYDTVVMIGVCHGVATKAAALSSAHAWETPLGAVPVDTELAKRFTEASPRIEFDDRAHAQEHSLEVQLPFLLTAAGGRPFKIVPMVTNSSDPTDQQTVANALIQLAADGRTLIIVSTDLSHFPDAQTAERVDKKMLGMVASLNADAVLAENRKIMGEKLKGLSVTMCGLEATLCLLRAAGGLGIDRAAVVSYTHSGMTAGDNSRVVGYGALSFFRGEKGASVSNPSPLELKFSPDSVKELLRSARESAKAAVEGRWVSYDPSDNPELLVHAGCFVTLTNQGKLRGCIGRFSTDEPLWKTVREMAVAAATMDDRFRNDPIKPEEFDRLKVEVSVLSPLRRVSDPIKEIALGRDGIVIRDKGMSGTFLPQVAEETGWSLEEFLGHCARDKAGLGWDGWKSPTAKVYAYTATVMHE